MCPRPSRGSGGGTSISCHTRKPRIVGIVASRLGDFRGECYAVVIARPPGGLFPSKSVETVGSVTEFALFLETIFVGWGWRAGGDRRHYTRPTVLGKGAVHRCPGS